MSARKKEPVVLIGDDWEVSHSVQCVSCPDCSFTFESLHVPNRCPECELEKLKVEVARYLLGRSAS